MPHPSRRAFVAWLASLAPTAVLARRAAGSTAVRPSRVRAELDAAALRALAAAVLPSELDADGARRAADEFRRWVAGYREGAELLHGYGTPAIAYAGPSPASRWAEQLRALDRAARVAHGAPLRGVPLERRRALVRDALKDARVDRMPAVAQAPHVALGLLAHFYASPEATDLAYRARIMRTACRPLARNPARPEPLSAKGAADA